MKTLMTILGCLFIAALLAPLLSAAATTLQKVEPGSLRSIKRAFGLHTGIMQVNAITDGIHPTGTLGHLLADAAITTRHLLVKRGSDSGHIALCGATDVPLGVCQDEPSAAEEPAAVALLGATKGTLLGVGSEEIAIDAEVYAAANGKLQNEPAVAGTYWRVGKAITACSADGIPFEFEPYPPTRVEIVANAADLTALKAALSEVALVKFLQS